MCIEKKEKVEKEYPANFNKNARYIPGVRSEAVFLWERYSYAMCVPCQSFLGTISIDDSSLSLSIQ